MTQLSLMAVLAHPDDESLGTGGILAKYGAEGVATHVVTATRGQRGRFFDNENRPDDAEVGRVREGELRAAAAVLGVGGLRILDGLDGELDRADHALIVRQVAGEIRRARPQVVVTFDPLGAYGHPDHIAISQLAGAAIVAAASRELDDGAAPHCVAKLYYMAWDADAWELYQRAFKRLVSRVDGVERQAAPWPGWAITTRVDARAHWRTVWRAVRCHETQLAAYRGLASLGEDDHARMWGLQTFVRAHSLVNGGRAVETDLFAGLR